MHKQKKKEVPFHELFGYTAKEWAQKRVFEEKGNDDFYYAPYESSHTIHTMDEEEIE